MMTQFRKRRFAVLRLGAAIPVVAAMMMLCSFTVKTPLPAAGDPDRPTVTVHISSGGKILFNGRPVTVGDLERLIAAEREKLSEADRAQMEVVLRADKDAPMADLADVMDASRRAHAFRLKLTADASARSPAPACRQRGLCFARDEPQRQVIARAVPLKLTEPRR